MKRDRRLKFGRIASFLKGTLLMRRSPDGAVIPQKDMLSRSPRAGPCQEAEHGLVGQSNVTNLALAQADRLPICLPHFDPQSLEDRACRCKSAQGRNQA